LAFFATSTMVILGVDILFDMIWKRLQFFPQKCR
jgi:hypothetical protein